MAASTTPTEIVDLMVQFFESAACDPELAARVEFADTVVAIHLTDAAANVGCTVRLAGSPIQAVPGIDSNAEIQLHTPTRVLLDVIAGRRAMSMAIAAGNIQYTGPVRKFLRVAPILQQFNFDMWRGRVGPRTATTAASTAASSGTVPGVPGT